MKIITKSTAKIINYTDVNATHLIVGITKNGNIFRLNAYKIADLWKFQWSPMFESMTFEPVHATCKDALIQAEDNGAKIFELEGAREFVGWLRDNTGIGDA